MAGVSGSRRRRGRERAKSEIAASTSTAPPPRNIHVPAAASPRPAPTEYPRRYLLAYDAPLPPRWVSSRELFDAGQRRYGARLTRECAARFFWRRESRVAAALWRDRVLPFLMDASTCVPEGWG